MKEIRKKIDQIDTQISSLLDERAKLVKQIGIKKQKDNEPVFAPHREKKIIERLSGESDNEEGFPVQAKMNIFSEIFAASRSMQEKLTVTYLGPEATYTHLAATRQFSDYCNYSPSSSIAQVFREVEKQRANYGVVPVENSTEGIVSHTLDMFIDSDCKICAELLMEISHNLVSKEKELSKIRTVYSHPQALSQCGIWLEENLPHADYIEVSSTSKAALKAANKKGTAAISSSMAAKLYDLNILAERIENYKENVTRFFVIGNEITKPSGEDKTTIMFSIKDRVGALHDILVPFKKNNINLTKIESRPSRMKAWEYIFFVDFEGHISEQVVNKALDELKGNCVFIKVLGSYPKARKLYEKSE
ncbi:MAG: prephenate dehydratase [Elusimicrobiota bacterium]